jgi:hypothetical protein
MRRVVTSLVLLITVAVSASSHAQSASPKTNSKGRKALYATLGAVAGAGLGALWILKLCPNGSDRPTVCIGPPIGFIAGGAWAGYKLANKTSPMPSSTGPAPATISCATSRAATDCWRRLWPTAA